MRLASFATLILVAGCDPAADQPPPAAPTYVTQTNNYTINVYTAAQPVVPPPEPIAPPPSPVIASPRHEPLPPPPPLPPSRTLPSTGVPQCDVYLARVEACSTQMLDSTPENQEALGRIRESLDLTRRTWRRVAASQTVSREVLVDQCETSLRMFNHQEWPAGMCSECGACRP